MRPLAPFAAALALVAPLALAPAPAAADDEAPPPGEPRGRVEVHADLQNVFLLRNDADFDRTRPLYDEDGQSVGALATVFFPSTTWHVGEGLRLFYQAELGLNTWSAQNPDQQDPQAPDVFVLKHRQVFAEGERCDGLYGFRVGYAHFQDPTGLFLNHWLGVAQGWSRWAEGRSAGVFVGQLPDSTHEGVLVTDNNLTRDMTVFGAVTRQRLGDRLALDAGLGALYDSHVVGRTRWFAAPSARLAYAGDRVGGALDLLLQIGALEGAAIDGGRETLLAWAAQAHADARLAPRLELTLNALALSPDDRVAGNGLNWALRASGKNRSSTLMLTEDEIRDWYDNYDERMATWDSGFYTSRAGLLVADATLTVRPRPDTRLSLVVGGATVLMPPNALDRTVAGVEADLIGEWRLSDRLFAVLAGGLLVPGGAAAALVNSIDRAATDPVVMTEASLLVRY